MKSPKGARLLHSCLIVRRQLSKLLSSGELSQGEYLVLRNIWLSKQRVADERLPAFRRAADLSEILELSRPSITRILNDLERKGYVTRSIDPNDRRQINIELTADGEKAVQKANEKITALAERLVTALGDNDTDKLIELLGKLADIYTEIISESGDAGDE